MKRIISFFVWSITAIYGSYAQTYYNVEFGIQEFTPIVNATSIVDEDGVILLNGTEKEFELPFTFPYFSDSISQLLVDLGTGSILFGNSDDFNAFLFGSTCELWTFFSDTISSDVTYAFGVQGGVQYFNVDFLELALLGEFTSDTPQYHKISYSIRIYENGTIKFQFGQLLNIEESEFWDEQNGINISDGFDQGPYVWMESGDFTKTSGVIGTFENPLVSENYDSFDAIRGYPPDGWFCEFIPVDLLDGVAEINSVPFQFNSLVEDELMVQFDAFISEGDFQLFSMDGKMIKSLSINEKEKLLINLSDLSTNHYFFLITTKSVISRGKLIKL